MNLQKIRYTSTEVAMAETDPMTINKRRKYICKIRDRYKKGNKHDKTQLLIEAESITSMHRESLVRLLNRRLSQQPCYPSAG